MHGCLRERSVPAVGQQEHRRGHGADRGYHSRIVRVTNQSDSHIAVGAADVSQGNQTNSGHYTGIDRTHNSESGLSDSGAADPGEAGLAGVLPSGPAREGWEGLRPSEIPLHDR